MFLEAVSPFIEKTKQASQQNQSEEVARQVHAFRPKLMMMGMKNAQELAADIERQCRENMGAELNSSVEELIRHCLNAQDELKAWSINLIKETP